MAIAVLRLIPGVNPTTAGFAFLILVLLAATLGPLWIAITRRGRLALAFNYFFFPPVGTFTIAEPHNWVSLFAFLVDGPHRQQPVGGRQGARADCR